MARINLQHLETFLSVVRLGGVRRAADGLNLTQPAVTARIKALEESLGAELFERTSGGMRLTKRGELLQSYAVQFEHLTDMVERDVIPPDGLDGRLRIGVAETIVQCWLPDFIARLHERYPRLEIEVNVDVSTNLRAALLDGLIDLAVLLGPVSEYTVDNIALPGFDLRWYVSADAPHHADVADYLRAPVLTYPRNSRPYRELRKMLLERVGPGVSIFPSSSLSACFRLVEASLGVAALPKALGDPHVRAGTVREFDPGWVPPPLVFSASYIGAPNSHLHETAAQIAQEVAEGFAGDNNT
ncbi:LysR family transcriptional regulator [Tropicimonas aquimaris]|uniref:LysR family transcriptional regulator n=1 Tax=Tropicimonas aquimaris TaxID=914152 RepID=A0ABW3IVH2_9RHOB